MSKKENTEKIDLTDDLKKTFEPEEVIVSHGIDKTDNPFSQLFASGNKDEENFKMVNSLFSTENLEHKTDLTNPLKFSILKQLQLYLKNKNLLMSANILEQFINTSFSYLISKNRSGRTEFVSVLQSLLTRTIQTDVKNISQLQNLNPIVK